MVERIAAIGSGFGGLAAAVRLQALGFAVTLIEARDKPGGRACVAASPSAGSRALATNGADSG